MIGLGAGMQKGGMGKKVVELSEDLKGWLGKDYRKIVNDSGDLVLLSKDGTRKLRFDIKNPRPHTNPHSHIEVLKDGKWEEVKWEGQAQLYPKDVPKY